LNASRPAATVGVVVIGRNEGARLRRCLNSVLAHSDAVVYIDSGSSDGSMAMSTALGARSFALDMENPFTAARARNEGVRQLLMVHPDVEFIQFVDGDCEVADGWIETARMFLEEHAEVAVVCGRRRERHPERSMYNRLCDIEWNTPIGETKACGGDALARASSLQQVGGFRDDLIAGEEPELCVRLRAEGWKIWRLDAEMTLHDAAMTRFSQWWKRSARGGYAFAEGAHIHGAPPERHWVRESRSAWAWGFLLPAAIFVMALVASPLALCALLVYPLQVLRLSLRGQGRWTVRLARSFFLVLGKFAEDWGQLKYLLSRLSGSRGRLIEYK
jgi:glycosyltransferase involved in cell wall biosynthesis